MTRHLLPSSPFTFFGDNFLDDLFIETKGSSFLKTNIIENDDSYVLELEVPGVKKENISINLEKDTLTITVEKTAKELKEKEAYLKKEQAYGTFTRAFYVGNIKQDSIKAKNEDGILTVIIPKEKPIVPEKKQISIE
ncbi:MAG: Hsp20/alpha crystallin family protein [Bacillales bacterium]|jgi:HSP20 family protein|nr:Hsp20/alpha crystallin family protein [Bacillales bacterium]